MGRGNSLKVLSVIVFLFAAVLMMGQLPAGKLKAFANNSCGPTGVDSYIKIDKGDGNPVLIYKGNNSGFSSYTFGTVQGISYDKESNTITVKNLNKPKWSIETDEMGVDLKLNVVGTCALKSIYIPVCKKIGGYTFYECKGIRKLITSDDMNYIGTRAFSNCTSILEVNVGSGCNIIGSYAFCGNTSLTKVTGCKSATLIDTGTAVTVIGQYAFQNTTSLKKLYLRSAKIGTVGEYALKGINAGAVIYVPKSVLGKYSTGIFKNKGQAAGVRFSGI